MRNILVHNGVVWKTPHSRVNDEFLGLIPEFISAADERPLVKQINANYGHGGGWRTVAKFVLKDDKLQYPGDSQPYLLIAQAAVRDETLMLFESSWVAVVKGDGSYEVARID